MEVWEGSPSGHEDVRRWGCPDPCPVWAVILTCGSCLDICHPRGDHTVLSQLLSHLRDGKAEGAWFCRNACVCDRLDPGRLFLPVSWNLLSSDVMAWPCPPGVEAVAVGTRGAPSSFSNPWGMVSPSPVALRYPQAGPSSRTLSPHTFRDPVTLSCVWLEDIFSRTPSQSLHLARKGAAAQAQAETLPQVLVGRCLLCPPG